MKERVGEYAKDLWLWFLYSVFHWFIFRKIKRRANESLVKTEGVQMSEIVQGQVGAEGSYDVAFSGGALQVTGKYAGKQASVAITASVSGTQLIQSLEEHVSNPVEKEALELVAGLIAKIP